MSKTQSQPWLAEIFFCFSARLPGFKLRTTLRGTHETVRLHWKNRIRFDHAGDRHAGSNAGAQQPSFEVASIKPVQIGAALQKGPINGTPGCRGTDSHSPGITLPMGRCV